MEIWSLKKNENIDEGPITNGSNNIQNVEINIAVVRALRMILENRGEIGADKIINEIKKNRSSFFR
ncbi:hypothetical protein [Brevibacillus sp. MER 51]|uniref:hypothetical protein n=1 Tax=Brevibacillus sp. MER 51 TaxID=2939560 RepID=UPI00203B6327|nr:hypothetical protein [Brevibacillus sp. MER 51]MCM3144316.1 hypothetical protein [Brevibacillus sp. MER 51]